MASGRVNVPGVDLQPIVDTIVSKGGSPASKKVDDIVAAINDVANWDADLIAENIVNGVNIFGIVGSFDGKRWASGTATATGEKPENLVVRGLSFRPSYVIVTGKTDENLTTAVVAIDGGVITNLCDDSFTGVINVNTQNGSCVFYNDGFDFTIRNGVDGGRNRWSGTLNWYAFE